MSLTWLDDAPPPLLVLMHKITWIRIRSVHLGISFGKGFFLLRPQRLPICNVDPLKINGRCICWLSLSARWTLRISFDADHPCERYLWSSAGHRQQGKSKQSTFSMLIFSPLLETAAEVEIIFIYLVLPDRTVRLSDCSDDSSNDQSRRFAIIFDCVPTPWSMHWCWGIVWSPSQSSATTTKVYIPYSEHWARVHQSHVASDEWGFSTEL